MPRSYDQTNLPQRMWVNQPSSQQSHHDMHGMNVLAVWDYGEIMRVYPTSGDIVSTQMHYTALSPGWR